MTIYHSTPTVFRQAFADQATRGDLAGVRLVVIGGEATTRADFERFRSLFPSTAWFVNGLGPTESTVTLQNFLPASAIVVRHSVPVGLPIDGPDVELLEPDGRVTAAGERRGECDAGDPHSVRYYRRLIVTPPFVVIARSFAPPAPSVAVMCRPSVPCTVMGNDTLARPLVVPVSSSAE